MRLHPLIFTLGGAGGGMDGAQLASYSGPHAFVVQRGKVRNTWWNNN